MTGDDTSAKTERTMPPPKDDPGAHAVDDHVAGRDPRGRTQPTEDLDPGIDDEHLRSPSQGVRPEQQPG